MSASILLVILAIGQAQPAKPVTDAEKQEFLKVLSTLPTRGEFFTEDAVKKAVPYTRVLLSLTEKDVEKYDLYGFLALSTGLMEHEQARKQAIANFGEIAHPVIKLAWAILLFKEADSRPMVTAFLRKAFDSKEQARTMSQMLGGGFEDFKDEVLRAHESGKLMKVELVKQHSIQAFPKYGGGHDYSNKTYVFAPGPLVHAVRPLNQRGELTTYDVAKRTTRQLVVPQPKGFEAKLDFERYFDSPVLSLNSKGDLSCRWAIRGNGDGGLALLTKGGDWLPTKRIALPIQHDSIVVVAPDGGWYLVEWSASSKFTVHQVDKELGLTELGSTRRSQSASILDARFISNEVLHLVFSSGANGNKMSLRCVDFDVKQRSWLHNRQVHSVESGWLRDATVLRTADGTLDYVWAIEALGKKNGAIAGLYYQAESDAITVKLGNGYHHRAIAVGDRIVVCYTQEDVPEKAFFRVVYRGSLGPVTEITAAKGRKDELSAEDMVLHAETDRIWFVNTLMPNTLHELTLVDVKKP